MPSEPPVAFASRRFAAPVGLLLITARHGAITHLTWAEADGREIRAGSAADRAVLDRAVAQLAAYFAGDLRRFDVPLAPAGTPFQRRVWDEISAIPCGRTRTYGDLARAVGGVARAVGQACAANPIPLFIPCHRVVAGGGRLGGFSGGLGRASKCALLAHEHAVPDGADLFAPERTVTDAPLGR